MLRDGNNEVGADVFDPGVALDFFSSKVKDAVLYADIKRAVVTGNTDVMRQALESAHRGWGTSVVIGVALDTVKQLEAQLMMRNYEGFLK